MKHDISKQFKEVPLSSKYKSEWSDTRTYLTCMCPGFSHIFYTMLNNNHGNHVAYFTADIPTLATDGVNVLINQDFFFPLPIKKRVFTLAHEILHAVLNHIVQVYALQKQGHVPYPDGKKIPFIQKLSNIAQDYVINAMLVNSKVGEIDEAWLYDAMIATHKDQWYEIYRKLYQELDRRGKIKKIAIHGDKGEGEEELKDGGKPVVNGESFDEHLAPGATTGKEPEQCAKEREAMAQEWTNAIAGAASIEAKRGDKESPLKHMFEAMITPRVTWSDHIQGIFARKVGSGGYNFRRMDKRMVVRDLYVPERSGLGVNIVVLALDHSGSVSPKQVGSYLGEFVGIFDSVNPRRVIVLWCDMNVTRVDDVEDVQALDELVKYMPPPGGTAFEPVFKWVAENDITPDALVYLTDGEGSFPKEAPAYPVVWGSIKKSSKYPWGDVVDLSDLK